MILPETGTKYLLQKTPRSLEGFNKSQSVEKRLLAKYGQQLYGQDNYKGLERKKN